MPENIHRGAYGDPEAGVDQADRDQIVGNVVLGLARDLDHTALVAEPGRDGHRLAQQGVAGGEQEVQERDHDHQPGHERDRAAKEHLRQSRPLDLDLHRLLLTLGRLALGHGLDLPGRVLDLLDRFAQRVDLVPDLAHRHRQLMEPAGGGAGQAIDRERHGRHQQDQHEAGADAFRQPEILLQDAHQRRQEQVEQQSERDRDQHRLGEIAGVEDRQGEQAVERPRAESRRLGDRHGGRGFLVKGDLPRDDRRERWGGVGAHGTHSFELHGLLHWGRRSTPEARRATNAGRR